MSLLRVNKIEPTMEGGSVEILGFRFLEKLLGDITYRGDWVSDEVFGVDDVVIYADKVYRATTGHTSTSTFDPTKWELVDVTVAVNGAIAGDYSKVRVDSTGRVISGLTLDETDIPSISATKINSGLVAPERLGSGTPTSGKYLRGDGVWVTPDESTFGTVNQEFTATEGQTAFTLTNFSYSPGAGTIAVYLNGVRMNRPDDYTETTGTGITFTYGLAAGDRVSVIRGERYTTVTDPVIREQLLADNGSTLVGHSLGETVSDALNNRVLISDLANATDPAKGAGMSGYGDGVEYADGTVGSALQKRIPAIGNYAALRAYTGSITAFWVRGSAHIFDGGFGMFRVDPSDTTTADNGGTTLIDATGRRWKREYSGHLCLEWFGAAGDGVTDDALPIQRAINAATFGGVVAPKVGRIYAASVTIDMAPGVIVWGPGSFDQHLSQRYGLWQIKALPGLTGPVIRFSSGDAAAALIGGWINCDGQVSGHGVHFVGDPIAVRNICRMENMLVSDAAEVGIYNGDGYMETKFFKVMSLRSGSHGFVCEGQDCTIDSLWASTSEGCGIVDRVVTGRPSGGNRYINVDAWRNKQDGIVIQSSGGTYIRIQSDLNGKAGIRLNNKANKNKLIGLKLLGGEGTYSGMYSMIEFDDSGLGAPYANEFSDLSLSDTTAYYKHAIDDLCAAASNNTFSGIDINLYSASGTAFAKGAISPKVAVRHSIINATFAPASGETRSEGFPVESGARNILVNGDFSKSGLSGAVAGWDLQSVTSAARQFDAEIGVYGRFTSSGGSAFNNVRQYVMDIAAYRGRKLVVTGLARASASNTSPQTINLSGAVSSTVAKEIPADGQWHFFSDEITIAATETSMRFQASVTGASVASGQVLDLARVKMAVGPFCHVTPNPRDEDAGFYPLTVNSSTPSVGAGGRNWYTENTAPTVISNFSNGYIGKDIYVFVRDTNTSFDFAGGSLSATGGGTFAATIGDVIHAIYDGVRWRCYVMVNV